MKINYPSIARQNRWCLFIVLCSVPLAGCISIPPILDYASWAISSITYMTTSKGLSDHAISSVMKRDCSLLRVLLLKPICIPVNEDTNKPLWVVLFNKGTEEIPAPPDLLSEVEVHVASR